MKKTGKTEEQLAKLVTNEATNGYSFICIQVFDGVQE
jgi:hypothetical protein